MSQKIYDELTAKGVEVIWDDRPVSAGVMFADADLFGVPVRVIVSPKGLKNGTIDAAFVVAGYPTTAVSELASTYDFNILAVDEEHANALMSEYGFYTYGVIPGGTYGPVAEDVPAVAVMATIIARNDVPEDTIYALVKGIFDNQEEIAVAHAKGAELSIENATSGMTAPFHAGAAKYFAEQGVTVETK